MFYYCILLVVGNDINPSTIPEFRYCSAMLFIGAFVEGYIIGAITSEIAKGDDQIRITGQLIDYVNFSMDIHVFPNQVKKGVTEFLVSFGENIECRPEFKEFMQTLNPSLQYQFILNYYFKTITQFGIFKNVRNQIEVMSVAEQLTTDIFMKDEIIMQQGDEASDIYIVF
jgi:hypothetical protein